MRLAQVSRQPSKILYVNSTSLISGAEISLLSLLKHLDRDLFEPVVALPGDGPLVGRLKRQGVEVITTPLHKIRSGYPFPYLRSVYRLAKAIRERAVDLVHCNMDICNQYALPAARLNRVPVVCHTRNILGGRAFRRMFLAFADVLVANSRAVADSYASYVRNPAKIHVVHNGLDLADFSAASSLRELRKALGIKDEAFAVGHIGRICWDKGQHILIKALAEVVQSYPNVFVLIVGSTEIDNTSVFLNELEVMVSQMGLSEHIVFTGFVEDMAELYSALDLLVLPSSAEPFGRTLIEAMAASLPVIATKAGGAVEIVEDEMTGLLVPPEDPSALARSILRLAQDRDFARRLGRNGNRRAEHLFRADKHARAIENIYRDVLQK